ncbi:ESX secretion-associated protein EspG [Saccharopolyspora hirsuta]|uniref:ESX secretion-associated protein EspG n=1 Tax=Saccharopolyspora hirsuta TaxID=1837 RepID=A0A5M7C547_SACHI|nr:ESX secretion-associated protein EspG [Saccharopolyspora hirsuta]KAA5833465.1 ESX secretion-associated protein EspG [Saccharopolyspora hirsuta]MBF6507855.1 ESX secretion-associated protein EspG [Nocardia farcinica]
MSERWLLPPLWFDFCWEIGRFDEYPFPIAVRSHGATLEERAVLRQRALPEMQAAGLLGGTGLAPRFGQVLAQLAKPGLWVEGLWLPDETTDSPVRLMSVASEEGALLLVQDSGESESYGGDLRISVHPRTSVVAAAIQGMPPAPPGKRPRLAVPCAELAQQQGPVPDESFDEIDMMQSASTPKRTPSGAEALRAVLEEQHLRDGQFTVNMRDRHGRTRRSQVLKWFDAREPDGRYGVTQQQRPGVGPELVLAPLAPPDLGKALENRVAEVRTAA